jgi:hypothetical protein
MQKELEAKLIERFPTYFEDMYGDPTKTCMAFGCECGAGWFDLIFRLCEDIEKTNPKNFKVEQVKEKFGGLRFYYSGGSQQVNDLVNKAECDSYNICENCGTRENVTSEGSWILTLCKTCREKR